MGRHVVCLCCRKRLFNVDEQMSIIKPGEWRKVTDKEMKELLERDPNGIDLKTPGAKADAGKSPVRQGLLEYFPRACLAVAEVSAVGARKYSWKGWEKVENGVNRYGDAEVRHICYNAIEGPIDNDTKLLHATQEAWNAFARLELILKEKEGQDKHE